PAEKKGNLKKQSQFAPALMGATTYVKGDYENKPAGRAEENKPNSKPNKPNPSGHSMSVRNCRTDQSQFQVSPNEKGGEKREAGKLLAGLECGKD
ncbi:MAG TPA: hypothetical protein VMX36_15070, partial [Sedimentisphaerales bacterium]|nr:hypothetical protein [Sedimentisphaerales bacterium]